MTVVPHRQPITLQATGVTYTTGETTLLQDITLELAPRKVYALTGPNGAGKSTLLRLLAGDIVPTAGEVRLDRRPLREYSKQQLALKRSVMPQDVAIALAFTAEEVVWMGRYPHLDAKPTLDASAKRRAKGGDHAAVVQLTLQQTETDPLRHRIYPTLSGGEQARITLARVLAQDTPLLFLDEPTASLDPRHQHLVMGLAQRHAQEGGTIVAVLHDLNLAAAYADDIILLSNGRIRAQGVPADVLQAEILEEVFQTKFSVTDHPRFSHPLVLSMPAP